MPTYEQMKQGQDVIHGWTDIARGMAYADDALPYNAKHEMTHLWTCGTWHDSDGHSLGYLQRYPNADSYAWCKKYEEYDFLFF
jgi:hypothetical protein